MSSHHIYREVLKWQHAACCTELPFDALNMLFNIDYMFVGGGCVEIDALIM